MSTHLLKADRVLLRCGAKPPIKSFKRCLHHVAKLQRLSKLYVPTSKIDDMTTNATTLRSVQYLTKAGFIRQASTGIYALLPYGQKVLEKVEKIIEEEMFAIDASRVSLPNLLTSTLWQKSGRWESTGPELMRFLDRRNSQMLLAPTHEEEITALVGADVHSERGLPVRLFQIGRKFRDEARPRAGLLRGREFVMKDLYTFDASMKEAKGTYDEVKAAYCKIFDRLGLRYLVAEADTGNIGGTDSHEFHYPSSAGEDTVLTCEKCNHSANAELASSLPANLTEYLDEDSCHAHILDIPSRRALAAVILRKDKPLNLIKVKRLYSDAKYADLSRPLDDWDSLKILVDETCIALDDESQHHLLIEALKGNSPYTTWPAPPSYHIGDFRVAEAGELCRSCRSPLTATTSIEVGHTFLLGDKYSRALETSFVRTQDAKQTKALYQMGCYGIGVSRLIGAIAETLADEKGLKWPAAIAPYKCCVIALDEAYVQAAAPAFNYIRQETVLDDRYELSFGKRMRDAELIGYPYIVVLGRSWKEKGEVELHNRLTGDKSILSVTAVQQILQ